MFSSVTTSRAGTLLVPGEWRPKGRILNTLPYAGQPLYPLWMSTVAKNLAVAASEKCIVTTFTVRHTESESGSYGFSRSVLWQQTCAGPSENSFPRLPSPRSFFSRLFTPTAFDSFSHLTFNFIKFIQEWHDQYWYILHLDHPGFCLFWWYWGWNPGLAHVRQAVYRWVPCIPTPPLG